MIFIVVVYSLFFLSYCFTLRLYSLKNQSIYFCRKICLLHNMQLYFGHYSWISFNLVITTKYDCCWAVTRYS